MYLKINLHFITYKVDNLDNCENVLFDKTAKWLLLKSLYLKNIVML